VENENKRGGKMKNIIFNSMWLLWSILCISWGFHSTEEYWIKGIILMVGILFGILYTYVISTSVEGK